jgi:hypothetical protein
MNNAMMNRILTDYADQTKTCWASDSGKAVSECWCAQCAEGRTFYPVAVELNLEIERLKAVRDSYKAKRDEIVNFIQKSIDNGDWEASELEEIFWEELAEIADLRLRRTKEVEFKVTLTYYGSATVPVDCDVESDVEIEGVPNELEFMLNRELLDDQTCNWDSQEIEIQ